MAVAVKLFATLVGLSRSKRPQFEMEWWEGMTARDLLTAEGFSEKDEETIAAVVNGEQADWDTALRNGDRVELLVGLQGG